MDKFIDKLRELSGWRQLLAAAAFGVTLDLDADHSGRRTELVDDLLAGDLEDWLSEPGV